MNRLALSLALSLAACGGGSSNTDGGGPSACSTGEEKFQDVCLIAPTMPAAATACGEVTEYCSKSGDTTPSLACLGTTKMHAATPATVTLTGFVHPFSSGKSNSDVTIQIFKAADLLGGADITTATPVVPAITVTFDPSKATDPTQFRACDTDPKVGCQPVTPGACTVPPCNDGLMGRADDGKYCHSVSGTPTCSDRLRWEARYSIDGVPTNTPLVVRSSGKGAAADQQWAVLVTWSVFLAADDAACKDAQATDCLDLSDAAHPKYQLNVNVLSQSDYFNIPNASGLAGGLSSGLGAVAGEVHDCNNVRLGNVQVGVQPGGDRFTYFNGNPLDTVPDASRAATGTDRLGLFAALNVPPGKILVEAVGLVGGMETPMGKATAYVYPNSVSVVTLNGGKPQ